LHVACMCSWPPDGNFCFTVVSSRFDTSGWWTPELINGSHFWGHQDKAMLLLEWYTLNYRSFSVRRMRKD
jgi:hypothetical protein